jgi:hypothetical protein
LSTDEKAGEPFDLQRCRETGHLLLDGKLGAVTVVVVMTPYAQERMKQRDIESSEVLEALANYPSSHGGGKAKGRYEVAAKTDRARLRVIYERPTPEIVLVITTYAESD